jgi:uncharacterized protein
MQECAYHAQGWIMTTSFSRCSRLRKEFFLGTAMVLFGTQLSYGVDVDTATPQSAPSMQAADRTAASAGQELQRADDYLTGRGVAKDLVQAARWYRRAAEQGDPRAQMMLAYMYFAGAGVPKDLHQAFAWDLRAAADGSIEAKVNLAAMYLHGNGIKQDPNAALILLKEAAAKHNGRAEAYLGTMYGLGLGVPVDRSTAKGWFERGVKHHSPEAEFGLATLEATEHNRREDLAHEAMLFRLSAAKGYVPAMHSLGLLLANHPELPREPGEEVRMLTSAAQAGFWKSSAVLGMLARDGRYLPQDIEVSYRWFRIAVLQGGAPAEAYLAAALRFQAKQLGAKEQAVDKDAGAWLRAHPTDDLFTFSDGTDGGAFPDREAYAAIQALRHAANKEVPN